MVTRFHFTQIDQVGVRFNYGLLIWKPNQVMDYLIISRVLNSELRSITTTCTSSHTRVDDYGMRPEQRL